MRDRAANQRQGAADRPLPMCATGPWQSAKRFRIGPGWTAPTTAAPKPSTDSIELTGASPADPHFATTTEAECSSSAASSTQQDLHDALSGRSDARSLSVTQRCLSVTGLLCAGASSVSGGDVRLAHRSYIRYTARNTLGCLVWNGRSWGEILGVHVELSPPDSLKPRVKACAESVRRFHCEQRRCEVHRHP